MTSRRAPLTAMLAAGTAARLAYAALTRRPPGGEKTWTRTNHRGEPVTLLEGPAVTLAAVTAAALVPGLRARQRVALIVAGAGAGTVGGYDDLAGDGDRRGFRGHLGALAKGEVTTGAVKILGIGAAGLTTSLLLERRRPADQPGQPGSAVGAAVDVVINTGLVAGLANLTNLFDLRPGRAIKASLIAGAALAAGGPQARTAIAVPAGAVIALLPEDLGERAMLGDCGANAVGAMLGVAATTLPRPARIGVLAVVTGLTAASEKVSFTKVIERTPPLRWLDLLGRRPVNRPCMADPADQPEGGIPLGTQPLS
jgi:UDP-N-acetylmuramyl pentapeptide phosphotransferase/UDP-N-acetylglucosamine-1-phosphate transferase